MSEVKLTPEQQQVVENRGGSLLVSAAAGSGKTKVLVERLFRYIMEENCHVDDFLIITYTKAAAAELRSKIAEELSHRLAAAPEDRHLKEQLLRVYRADIKTVDAFCTGLLRENTHLLAREEDRHALTPDFRVLDEGEADLLRRRVLNRVLESFYDTMDESKSLLADTLGEGRDDRDLEKLVLELYGKLQSHAYPNQWLEENRCLWANLGEHFEALPYGAELLQMVNRKAQHCTALLLQAADRTQGDEKLAKAYGERFRAAALSFDGLTRTRSWDDACNQVQLVEFPRLGVAKGRADDPLVNSLKKVWESCKETQKKLKKLLSVSGAEAMEDLGRMAPAMCALLELTANFSAAYRAEKLRLNAADFSDQEHMALVLLTAEDGSPTPLGRQIAGRYREILVDEYQDTNEVQNAIFRAVSREEKNLFTVGDVKQSIYRFRLADPTIFLRKYQQFADAAQAAEGEQRRILLSRNFRSRQEILDAANYVFENILSVEMGEMDYGPEEKLYFGAEYYPPRTDCETEFHLISAHRKSKDYENPVKRLTAESRFVAGRIRKLLDDGYPVTDRDGTLRPCRPEDVVILMRSPGSRVTAYAQALAEQNIPCSFSQSDDFFHTMEVSTALALLEIIDNPRQDVPLIAVLRSPVFGFTPDRLAEIRSCDRNGDFYDAVVATGGEDCVPFLELLEELRQAARDLSVNRLLWYIYDRLNLLGVFGAMDSGSTRRENLIALSGYAENFEGSGYRGLFAFVTQLRRLLETDRDLTEETSASAGGVQMMSIHRSKGLEFPIVVLTDLDHTFSNLDFRTQVLVHPEMGLGPQCVDLERRIEYPTLARMALEDRLRRENLAEEQRLLYVAMTRPKEKLILVDAVYGAEKQLQKLTAMTSCPVQPEVVAEGKSYSDWLLLTLLNRPEAEPLRRMAGAEPGELATVDYPWKVEIHDSEEFRTAGSAIGKELEQKSGEETGDLSLLDFHYPYQREAEMPAKLTATQLKGRLLDEEIAENAQRTPYLRPLSQPKFRREQKGLTPAERGTATHLVLQYLDLADHDLEKQIASLQTRGLLTAQQAEAVNRWALQHFLISPLAEEIRRSPCVQREYRFSLLVDAATYDPALTAGDQVMLQGVVDCWFETPAGVTVVDFKTDFVKTEEDVREHAARYLPQLQAYSLALEQVLEKKVTRKVLFFLQNAVAAEIS